MGTIGCGQTGFKMLSPLPTLLSREKMYLLRHLLSQLDNDLSNS